MKKQSLPNFNKAISIFTPSYPLRNIVQHYEWAVFDKDSNTSSLSFYPSFGNGIGFYFWLDERLMAHSRFFDNKVVPDAVIFSPVTSPFTATNFKVFTLLRVVFKPGMMNCLFDNAPMSEFCDYLLDATLDLDKELRELHDQMRESDGCFGKVVLLNKYLLSKLKGKSVKPSVFSYLDAAFRMTPDLTTKVEDVANELGISRQHLTRIAKNQLGYSSRQTLNILRFNRTQKYFHQKTQFSLAQSAVELGYFDQSHLTNTFRKFSGKSPKEYMRNLGAVEVYGKEYDFVYSGMLGKGSNRNL